MHADVRLCRITGGLIAVGCLLYPLGWNNAEVVHACTALAHRYSWGQHSAAFPVASGSVKMVIESSTNTCAQPDTKSNPNPNPNPTTKQHAVVNIQLNMTYTPFKFKQAHSTIYVRIQRNS